MQHLLVLRGGHHDQPSHPWANTSLAPFTLRSHVSTCPSRSDERHAPMVPWSSHVTRPKHGTTMDKNGHRALTCEFSRQAAFPSSAEEGVDGHVDEQADDPADDLLDHRDLQEGNTEGLRSQRDRLDDVGEQDVELEQH